MQANANPHPAPRRDAVVAMWRKVAGVEPTGKRLTSPPGLKSGRTTGCACLPNSPMTRAATVGSLLVVPTAVGTQHTRIARAPSIANTVEELQNLNHALTTNTDGISIVGRFHEALPIAESF